MSEKKQFRPRLTDDEFIDQIVIGVIPRFKTSGLSGDEWRRHVRIAAFRKGHVVAVKEVGTMAYAQAVLATGDWWTKDTAVSDPTVAKDQCDQPGCAETWTVLYRRVKDGCGQCGSRREHPEDEPMPRFQAFCERHAHRGTSSLHDSDDNYQPVIGAHPSEQVVNPEDESKSMFGGVIKLLEDDADA